MKRLGLGLALLFSSFSMASAADIYSGLASRPFGLKDVAPPSYGVPFTGFEVWADIGYAQAGSNSFDSILDNVNIAQDAVKPEGIFGGVGAGYNVALGGAFRVGLDTHVQIADVTDNSSDATVTIHNPAHGYYPASTTTILLPSAAKVSMDWFGATRLKGGVVFGNSIFLYGHAGFAYGGVSASSNNEVATVRGSDTLTGWTAGGGIEAMISDHWSMNVEYSHYDFGDLNLAANIEGVNANIHHANMDMDAVMCGIKYHF